jgi:hypothetical protein
MFTVGVGVKFRLATVHPWCAQCVQSPEPQHSFRRRGTASAGAALGTTLCQSLIYGRDQLLVFQHLVSLFHPLFAQIAYLFRKEAFAEVELLPALLNHAEPSSWRPACAIASPAATVGVSGRDATSTRNSPFSKRPPKLVAPGERFPHALAGRTTSGSCRPLGK